MSVTYLEEYTSNFRMQHMVATLTSASKMKEVASCADTGDFELQLGREFCGVTVKNIVLEMTDRHRE